MSAFGIGLGGFGQAYPGYEQRQIENQMNQFKLKQAIQQMAQDQQTRTAQQKALQGLSSTQGSGPGGTITPQQLAGLTNDPGAFAALNTAVRPANTGMFGLQGRDIAGQYGMERTALSGENAAERARDTQSAISERADKSAQSRQKVVDTQQAGANQRNKNTVEGATARHQQAPQNVAASPEFRTAKSEYEEAKKDERNIEAHYPNIAMAYNDPQWLDARKRSITAQAKMEKITSTAAKAAPAQPAQAAAVPLPDELKTAPDGTTVPDSTGKIWVKQGDKLIPQ